MAWSRFASRSSKTAAHGESGFRQAAAQAMGIFAPDPELIGSRCRQTAEKPGSGNRSYSQFRNDASRGIWLLRLPPSRRDRYDN
jgi:hypothetical protein